MPSSHASRGVFPARVVANEAICVEHFRLRLAVPGLPPSRPGQFVQLLCRAPGERGELHEVAWGAGERPEFTGPELTLGEPLLRRPISLAGRRDGADGPEIELICRLVGTGTALLAEAAEGDELSVLGPLGNGFPRPERPPAVLVGGGVGIPPMLYLAEALAADGREVVAIFGARSDGLMPVQRSADPPQEPEPAPCVADLPAGHSAILTTDDGTLGVPGTASDALLEWLRRRGRAHDLTCYCCGPEPLMPAVGDICIERDVPCWLALERHMACGMGTCQSCVVKIRDAQAEPGWTYKLCCTDGPVFAAREVLW